MSAVGMSTSSWASVPGMGKGASESGMIVSFSHILEAIENPTDSIETISGWAPFGFVKAIFQNLRLAAGLAWASVHGVGKCAWHRQACWR